MPGVPLRDAKFAFLKYRKDVVGDMTASGKLLMSIPEFEIYYKNAFSLFPDKNITLLDRAIMATAINSGKNEVYYAAGREASNLLAEYSPVLP